VTSVYRFLAWTLVLCAGLFGILRATAIRIWQVPVGDAELGASLEPVLTAGDWVILWRLTPPRVGSLVVCPDPDDANNWVVGRLMARASDTVILDKGLVTVNTHTYTGEHSCTDRKFTVINPDNGEPVELNCDVERVADVLHPRLTAAFVAITRKFETKVKRGHVFLVSDNRAFPFDSRHFGTVPEDTCGETAIFRLVGERGFFDVERRFTRVP
jgi:signal peptidase I